MRDCAIVAPELNNIATGRNIYRNDRMLTRNVVLFHNLPHKTKNEDITPIVAAIDFNMATLYFKISIFR